jgi:hypothetical protein
VRGVLGFFTNKITAGYGFYYIHMLFLEFFKLAQALLRYHVRKHHHVVQKLNKGASHFY